MSWIREEAAKFFDTWAEKHFTDEDWYWYGRMGCPYDRWQLVLGKLSLESWRAQRVDCRPRWLRWLFPKNGRRGGVMQARYLGR